MIRKLIDTLLSIPWCYSASQAILAPGANRMLTAALRERQRELPAPGLLLDVGCGPASWLWKIGWTPVGLDVSCDYTKAFKHHGQDAITGSACELPLANGVFDGVWCIGLLHHLQDDQARQAIREMLRVCRPGGHVIIQDAVLPESAWRRPIAALIRRLDRGRSMRTRDQLVALLPDDKNWHIRCYTYTLNGLEMLECSQQKRYQRHKNLQEDASVSYSFSVKIKID